MEKNKGKKVRLLFWENGELLIEFQHCLSLDCRVGKANVFCLHIIWFCLLKIFAVLALS